MVLLVELLTFLCWGQTASPAQLMDEPNEANEPIKIVVLHSDGTTPIQNAHVTVSHVDSGESNYVQTGVDGTAAFPFLGSGGYHIVVAGSGFSFPETDWAILTEPSSLSVVPTNSHSWGWRNVFLQPPNFHLYFEHYENLHQINNMIRRHELPEDFHLFMVDDLSVGEYKRWTIVSRSREAVSIETECVEGKLSYSSGTRTLSKQQMRQLKRAMQAADVYDHSGWEYSIHPAAHYGNRMTLVRQKEEDTHVVSWMDGSGPEIDDLYKLIKKINVETDKAVITTDSKIPCRSAPR